MLNFEFDPEGISEQKVFLGGISCFLYNTEVLLPYVESLNERVETCDSIPINVLYLVHHRGGDYTYMRGILQRIISQNKKFSKVPMIAVTFDARNHGEREIEKERNSGWKSKNDSHGVDMVSCIEGGVQDLRLVMDYLGCCLDLDRHISNDLKKKGAKICFNNILSGYSQGGHTVIRFGNAYPEKVSIINPNIGCSELSTLLVNRLTGTTSFDKKLFYSSYEELGLTEDQARLYPEALHSKISSEDMQIFEDYPFKKIKLFATFYDNDPLVPSVISKSWVEMYLNSSLESEVYIESGSIHDITLEMVDKFAEWLTRVL